MKTISLVTCLALAALGHPLTTRATTVTNGLITHLAFDGNYADSTTNAVNGAAVGSPTFETGQLGQAVHIKSSSDGSVNDYVTLGYPPALKFGTNDFSIAFWVKVNSQSDDKPFIANKNWSSLDTLGWVISSQPDGLSINLKDDGGSTARPASGADVGQQVLDHKWHHVAVTFARTSSASIYIDGTLISAQDISPDAGATVGSADTDTLGLNVNLGQDGTGAYTDVGLASIDMLMDDLGIWGRALTGAEVSEIFNKGQNGRTLDQDTGSIPTAITRQPANTTVVVGISTSLTVGAAGLNLTYQWQINGTNIVGATNATYTIAAASPADAGTYTAVVTGRDGTATSNLAVLTVMAPPTAPCAVTNGLITHLKFDGNYQDASGNGVNATNVGTPSFEPGLMGQAIHIVSTKDDVTNNYVTLNYPDALKLATNDFSISFWVRILSQSGDKPFVANQDFSQFNNRGFNLASQPDGMNWYLRDDAGTYRYSPHVAPQLKDGGWHHVAVAFARTGTGMTYLDGALVNAISDSPNSTNTVGSIDTADLGFRINFGQDGTGNYTGAGQAGIDMLMDDVAMWRRALTSDEIACIFTHGEAGRSFDEENQPHPVITSQPASQTVPSGATNVQFAVAATGLSLTYQWQFNGTGIAAATNHTYTLATVGQANAGAYTVVVTAYGGSVTSAVATLTVNLPPTITAQPQNQTSPPGGTATFSVTATGTAPLGYQWQFNGANLPGATNATLVLNNIATNQAGSYSVVVANSVGSTTSASATLSVTVPPPNITVQPQSQTVAVGGTAGFSVAATGAPPLSYQWQFNGANIAAATNTTLSLSSVTTNQAGTYAAKVTNPGGTVTSALATLTVTTTTTNGVRLAFALLSGNQLQISWSGGGNLQWADKVTGPWTDLNGSSPLTVPAGTGTRFYRLKVGATPAPQLQISLQNGKVQISWTGGGTLQSADTVTGAFADVAGATNPMSVAPTGSSKFYRLR